ncbi:MAG: hypothetical protein JNL41_00550 [Phenylobacterium sp.]|uniref:hypothetical protein n=1 Tax=Phenylobacterium sp. TaxID=1871053 RepID=UPI001A505B17|nr:hypothetical protein [Phenylobacterium sp.]MBL8552735.1 hypothetical protein [Phenylobacterium sp.]
MATFDLPEMPRAPVSPNLLLGVASPLWGYFGAAAASGVAYWWMTQWARPANLEALFDATAEALPEAVAVLAVPALEIVEAAVEAVEAATPDLPSAPVGGEAAPVGPVAAFLAPASVVEAVAEPEPILEPVVEAAPEPVVEAAPEPVGEAAAAPKPRVRKADAPPSAEA